MLAVYKPFEKELRGLGLTIQQGMTLDDFLELPPQKRKDLEATLKSGDGNFFDALQKHLAPQLVRVNQADEDKEYDVTEAAALLNVSNSEIIRRINSGKLLSRLVPYHGSCVKNVIRGSTLNKYREYLGFPLIARILSLQGLESIPTFATSCKIGKDRFVHFDEVHRLIALRYSGLTYGEINQLLEQSGIHVKYDSLKARLGRGPYKKRNFGKARIVHFADAYRVIGEYYTEQASVGWDDIAKLFGNVTHTTVDHWRQEGRIHAVCIGRRRYVYPLPEYARLQAIAEAEVTVSQLHASLVGQGYDVSLHHLYDKLVASPYHHTTFRGKHGIKRKDVSSFVRSLGVRVIHRYQRREVVAEKVPVELEPVSPEFLLTLGYVGSPADLSADAQRKLLILSRRGNNQAWAYVINIYSELLHSAAERTYVAHASYADKVAWAKLGLYNAVNTYTFRSNFERHAAAEIERTLVVLNREEATSLYVRRREDLPGDRYAELSLSDPSSASFQRARKFIRMPEIRDIISSRSVEDRLDDDQRRIYGSEVPVTACYSAYTRELGIPYHRVANAVRGMRRLALGALNSR